MHEIDIDISGQRSKHVEEVSGLGFDWVVTVCDQANESCPVFPGDAKRLHVGFDDPPRLAAGAEDEREALGQYRRVREEIRSFVESLPARLAHATAGPVRNVLVLCSQNSARSQMAEALLRKHGGDRLRVHSAGMQASTIHRLAIRVMDEIGVPLEGQRSKGVREYLGKLAVHDLIVVCARAERECPKLFPGALRHHFWPFPDPAAVEGPPDERLAVFREVRDGIERRVIEWLAETSEEPERGRP